VGGGWPDQVEERRGPRVTAPAQAIAGFVKSAGLTSIEEARIARDEKKGDFYVVRRERRGRAAGDIIAEALPQIAAHFPWPKSMRFNRYLESRERSAHALGPAGELERELRWVRPLRSIVCLLDGKIVPLTIAGLASGNTTR